MGRKLRISPMVALLFLGMLMIDESLLCLSVFLAAGFHELGHLCAARLLRIPVRSMKLDLLGARLDAVGRLLSYGEEWLLCVAGPLFSLLLSAGLAPLWGVSAFARQLSCVSLLLGWMNLLPIRTFDGGRMLAALISARFGEQCADTVLRVCSFFCLFLIWAVSVYFLLRVGDGLSLFCFSMSLFSHFFAVMK